MDFLFTDWLFDMYYPRVVATACALVTGTLLLAAMPEAFSLIDIHFARLQQLRMKASHIAMWGTTPSP